MGERLSLDVVALNVPIQAGADGQRGPRPKLDEVNEIIAWCGNVTEWGPKAEAYCLGTSAEEAHALLVCETHVAAGRARATGKGWHTTAGVWCTALWEKGASRISRWRVSRGAGRLAAE